MSDLIIGMGKAKTVHEESFKPVDIGEFRLYEPLTTKGAGFSKWGFCQKNGREYFIKQFLTPVYPGDDVDISPVIKNKRCKECMEWYEKKKVIYERICEARNGNLIVPFRFFKDKSHFYIVTDKIEKSAFSFSDVRRLSKLNMHILFEVIVSCFSMLSGKGIVHADIKPDNMIFKETLPGFYTVKIIDFDASYLQSAPPFGDDVQGTPEYFAPESFLALAEQKVSLTGKVDIFALGIIFHEMLCGKRPEISDEYDYIYEAVLNDDKVKLDESIPRGYRMIIENMLKKDPEERWSAAKIFNSLKHMEKDEPALRA